MTLPEQSEQPIWRSGSTEHRRWVAYGNDRILFHRPSGKTHLLNAACFDLLERVLVVPLTAAQSAARLQALHEGESVAGLEDHVVVLLERLDQLGLVERQG